MKTYDFNKVKKLISESAGLKSASLGMHEDWFWTAETIWEDGLFKKDLPDNADEIFEQYKNRRNEGMSMLSEEMESFQCILICGIYGSSWATPTLQLKFFNDAEKMIEVSKGETTEGHDPRGFGLGCLSGPVQENITPLSE